MRGNFATTAGERPRYIGVRDSSDEVQFFGVQHEAPRPFAFGFLHHILLALRFEIPPRIEDIVSAWGKKN
jgi:hypothetical protein